MQLSQRVLDGIEFEVRLAQQRLHLRHLLLPKTAAVCKFRLRLRRLRRRRGRRVGAAPGLRAHALHHQ